ncbi:cation:dicarboxylate symporter family transporter [Methyloprofundus sp.]|uniref:cation:dicarboxylate symporter family transporter n=1 Tax=Methyloprofundus sp. TaxID=2020875 RepID=UPI003D1003F7
MSFSTQVLLALCLGILLGLFFGEKIAWINTIGIAFIKLLQVSIIPYIVLSLVTGLGSLSYKQSREIARKFGLMLIIFWGLCLVTIFAMSFAFPVWQSSDFFSTNQIATLPEVNYYELYIPSNPFKSLANNTIPAIVVFSLLLGIALVNIKDKQQFLQPAIILLEAFSKITKTIVKFLPIGIFAIAAASAGTLQADDFEKLEIYFVVYISTALILSFWVIPFFISVITPFKYSDIVQGCRSILVTAFASGNLFILIPVMSEACNQIFAKYNINTEESDKYNEIIIPIAYNFPAMGKLLALSFILFSAWFSNTELSFLQQGMLAFNGLFSLFANVHISIPFLLNQLHLSSDLYQLYLSGDVLTKRFSTLGSAIFLLAFTLSSTAYLVGLVQFKIKKIALFLGSCVLVIALAVLGVQSFFNAFLVSEKDLSEKLKKMQVDWQVPQNISYTLPSTAQINENSSTPQAIVKRGTLRIGYNPAKVPFSFYNYAHELVGFDVEMMNHLSTSLGVKLEFIPFSKNKNLYQSLKYCQIDIVISGVQISDEYLSEVLYTQPTMNLTTALIVKDFRKKEFSDYSKIDPSTHLKVATMDLYPRLRHIQHNFPNIEITKISNPGIFFNAKDGQSFDGYISSIEEGMTLVMLHPEYAVTYDPLRLHRFPIGYAVNNGNLKLQAMLNSWIDIQKSTGRIAQLYDYWIQGGGAETKEPRWSILENVIKNSQ